MNNTSSKQFSLRTIMHVDMDAFFASVEQMDHPEWRGKPLVVGRASGRGVVSAASYEARRFGIRSAMPMFEALKRCPDVIVAAGRMRRYAELSALIMDSLSAFSPVVESISIDEAFVDLTGTERLFGSAHDTGTKVKNLILERTGLYCSVGIAPVRFLAKIASDMDKPDGLTVISDDQVEGILIDLPVAKVSGIGQTSMKVLNRIGVHTLGDVRQIPATVLDAQLGKGGRRLLELSWGRDPSPIGLWAPVKSVSTETTLETDISDKTILRKYLMSQADRVSSDLRKKGKKGWAVVLKIKWNDFKLITRSRKLQAPTQTAHTIFSVADQLLENEVLRAKVRLIGVGVGQLVDADKPVQFSLFESPAESDSTEWLNVENAIDSVCKRFGKNLVARGTQLDMDD